MEVDSDLEEKAIYEQAVVVPCLMDGCHSIVEVEVVLVESLHVER